RPSVEAEPAHPQDENTQRGERHVAAGYGIDLTTGPVLATARTEQQHTGQRRSGASHVDDAGAGIIGIAQLAQPAPTPAPAALYGIDEAGHDHRKAEECPELHALGHGAGNDGQDRKSTRLNSSHVKISYAVFCLKNKTN